MKKMTKEELYKLAVTHGVSNDSYSTVGWGGVASYSGTAVFTLPDGRRVKATGYGPGGTAEWLSSQGGIKFSLI